MRILYWTEPFFPYIGGIQVLAAKFLSSMEARGYEFVVITEHRNLNLPDQSYYCGFPIHRFHFWKAFASRDPLVLLEIERKIAQLKRNWKPDLIHLNFSGPSVFSFLNTANFQPAPLVVALRGTPTERSVEPETVLGHALCSANWVTAVSMATLDRARQLVPEIAERSSVIRNALELPIIAPSALSFAPPRLLCLGRLVPEKGFDLALVALARLVLSFPNLNLTIAGDGPERPKLEELALHLGLSQAVQFIGWVAPERVPELMNQTTIVVMPSRSEGLPQVGIQAAQMARPVVAARVGGLPEVVLDGETGLLVQAEDSDALASSIAWLLSHPEAAVRMGVAARFRAQVVFDWTSYLNAYDALYQRISAGG